MDEHKFDPDYIDPNYVLPDDGTDDISDELPAGDVPVAPVQEVKPEPAVAAEPFNQKQVIPGLHDLGELSLEGIALETKRKLSLEPTVRIMIPLDPGEKAGVAYRTICINGYRFQVRKHRYVELPLSVANLISDAYRITSEVLDESPLNLNNATDKKKAALGLE